LISCLEQISQTPDDPRQAQAFYELGVSSVSRFGNPNEMVPDRALEYFFAAAKHGNMTAKGYFKRLFGALSDGQSTDHHLIMKDYIDTWLLEAAVAGHQTAFDDYTAEGTDSSKKAMVIDLQVSGLFDIQAELPDLDEFRKEAELFSRRKAPPVPYNSTAVHWAAYKDLDEHIRILVSDIEFDINFRNDHGETPLMTACSMGNLKAALALVECGCEVNYTNNYGETCLHYIWRFCDEDAKCLLRVLVNSGIDFEIIAPMKRVHYDGKTVNRPTLETSPLPVLHGTAIERVAARGRLVLLDEFLRLGPSINPSNGNLVRRMILWASKLNFPDIRELLIQYGESRHTNDAWKKAPMNPRLPPIEKSSWENGGLKKDYMGAVAQGWLSSKGQGWSTPESFWRLCCHGQRWKSNLEGTIREIVKNSDEAICHFEEPLRHAMSDRRPEFCLAFLTMYINDHVAYPFPGHDNGQHTCESYQNPQTHMCGFDISPLTQRASLIDRILFKSPQKDRCGFEIIPVTQKASLIDRILFNNDGTLLQRSIIDGDRRMFQILGDLQASLIRPWSEMKPRVHEKTRYKTIREMGTRRYLNCYSVLAIHSKDIWFA
jgi:ankyrin repeat protein